MCSDKAHTTNPRATLAGGATAPPDPPFKSASGLPETRPKTRPDHPGLSRDSDFRPENSKRTRPDQFRPTFGLLAKSAKSQKADFCFIGGYLFMGPSWVEALGLIFGKVYIVWVCAPLYKPLSCRKNRIRGKRTSKFGPIFVTLMFCI